MMQGLFLLWLHLSGLGEGGHTRLLLPHPTPISSSTTVPLRCEATLPGCRANVWLTPAQAHTPALLDRLRGTASLTSDSRVAGPEVGQEVQAGDGLSSTSPSTLLPIPGVVDGARVLSCSRKFSFG